jgi:hypothetical protein
MEDMQESGRKQAAVYVSWVTFKNALEQFVQVVPNQVDRTAFPGMAGGVQSQLFTGLKFLGLINDDSKPTPALHALAVPDEAVRKKKLEALLRERYADLFDLDLLKATPAELASRMEASYSVTGGTRERAVRFFLSALDYLGIPVSKFLRREGVGNGATTPPRRRRSTSRSKPAQEEVGEEEEPTAKSGTSRMVTLKSGGTLSVSASIDIFSLSPEDRDFVFELIDKLKKYEQGEGVGSK